MPRAAAVASSARRVAEFATNPKLRMCSTLTSGLDLGSSR